jgi:hypothetical protein
MSEDSDRVPISVPCECSHWSVCLSVLHRMLVCAGHDKKAPDQAGCQHSNRASWWYPRQRYPRVLVRHRGPPTNCRRGAPTSPPPLALTATLYRCTNPPHPVASPTCRHHESVDCPCACCVSVLCVRASVRWVCVVSGVCVRVRAVVCACVHDRAFIRLSFPAWNRIASGLGFRGLRGE